MQKLFPLTLALLGTGSLAALAQGDDDRRTRMMQELRARFAKADTDGEGALSREEAKAMPRVASHFDAIDADHDGRVTMEEIGRYVAAQRGQ